MLENPTRAPPLLPSFTVAVASYPNFVSGESLAILLAFHCLLRTGEMLNMKWKDIHCRSKLGILTLPSTKSGTRFNIIESVPITDPFLLSIAAKGIRTHRPDNCLVCCSAAQFRVLFKKAVAAAQLPGGRLDSVFSPARWRNSAFSRVRIYGCHLCSRALGRRTNLPYLCK